MDRRRFLTTAVGLPLTAVLPASANPPRDDWHCYRNDDGEIVTARSAEEAGRWHDIEMGGNDSIQGDWSLIPDGDPVTIYEDRYDETGTTQLAREWAAWETCVNLIATTCSSPPPGGRRGERPGGGARDTGSRGRVTGPGGPRGGGRRREDYAPE